MYRAQFFPLVLSSLCIILKLIFFCHINFTRLCIPRQSSQNWCSPSLKTQCLWKYFKCSIEQNYCRLLRCFKGETERGLSVLLKGTALPVSDAHPAPCRISPWNITIWDKQVLKAVFLKLELESQLRKVPLGWKWRSQNIGIKSDSDMLGSFF